MSSNSELNVFKKRWFVGELCNRLPDDNDNDNDELFLWYGWMTKGV